MKNLVIKGGYGLRNFGDDALLYFLVNFLQINYRDLTIYVDCKYDEYLNSHGNFEVGLKNLEGDAILIYGGGTVFYHFPNQSSKLLSKAKVAFSRPSLIPRWLSIKFNELFRSKYNYQNTHMVGIGFGPFYDENSEQFKRAVSAAKSTDKIIVRDSASYKFVKNHSDNVALGTDICFAQTNIDMPDIKLLSKESPRIGVVLRDWKNGTDTDNYLDKTYQEAVKLREAGYLVDFIIFSDISDKATLKYLNLKGEEVKLWNPDTESIESFLSYLNSYDIFISSRFHGLIFSTLLSKPSIGIEIEPKITMAVENAVIKIWSPSVGKPLAPLIEEFIENYSFYQERCIKMVDEKRLLFSETFSV